jgi:hypothetical protein
LIFWHGVSHRDVSRPYDGRGVLRYEFVENRGIFGRDPHRDRRHFMGRADRLLEVVFGRRKHLLERILQRSGADEMHPGADQSGADTVDCPHGHIQGDLPGVVLSGGVGQLVQQSVHARGKAEQSPAPCLTGNVRRHRAEAACQRPVQPVHRSV